MRWSGFATLVLAHVAVIAASPGEGLFKRQACNRDNCFRAVVGTAGSIAPSSKLQDCSSFQGVTTAPCTLVVTVTATSTAPAVTTTGTLNVTSTSTETNVKSTTIFQYFTNTTTSISTTFTTNVTTATSTTGTVYAFSPAAQLKRRATTNLVCGTNSTSRVPPFYASACSGTVRYASACNCYGVTATTVTQATETSTFTTTVVTTPYVGANTTSVISEVATLNQTVSTTNTSSTTETDQTSTTATTTTTTTVNAQATITNKFSVQVGDTEGTYLARDADDENAAIFAVGTLQQALVFTLNGSQLVLFDNSYAVALSKGLYNPVAFVAPADLNPQENSVISCTVARANSTNGAYPLTCTDPDSPFPANRSGAWYFQSRAPTRPFPSLFAVSPYNNVTLVAQITG